MKKIGSIFALLALMMVASCQSDADIDTTRGRQPGTLATAYFSNDAETDIILLEDGDGNITFPLERIGDISKEVTVGIVKETGNDSIKVPQTVTFPAGDNTAYLTINCSKVEKFVEQNVILRIADDYANPYSQKMDGTDRLSVKFLVSGWVKIVDQANCSLVNSKNGKAASICKSDFYKVKGMNRFKVTNFMGLGYEMEFSLASSKFNNNDRSTWSGHFVPLTCYWDYTSYGSDYDYYCMFNKPGDSWGSIYIDVDDDESGIHLSEANGDNIVAYKGDYSSTGTQSFAKKVGDEYVFTLYTMFGSSWTSYNTKYTWTESQCIESK